MILRTLWTCHRISLGPTPAKKSLLSWNQEDKWGTVGKGKTSPRQQRWVQEFGFQRQSHRIITYGYGGEGLVLWVPWQRKDLWGAFIKTGPRAGWVGQDTPLGKGCVAGPQGTGEGNSWTTCFLYPEMGIRVLVKELPDISSYSPTYINKYWGIPPAKVRVGQGWGGEMIISTVRGFSTPLLGRDTGQMNKGMWPQQRQWKHLISWKEDLCVLGNQWKSYPINWMRDKTLRAHSTQSQHP